MFPPRLLGRPLTDDINFFQEPSNSANIVPLNKSVPIPIVDDIIDERLLEAMKTHKERTQAISIERAILSFVQSK